MHCKNATTLVSGIEDRLILLSSIIFTAQTQRSQIKSSILLLKGCSLTPLLFLASRMSMRNNQKQTAAPQDRGSTIHSTLFQAAAIQTNSNHMLPDRASQPGNRNRKPPHTHTCKETACNSNIVLNMPQLPALKFQSLSLYICKQNHKSVSPSPQCGVHLLTKTWILQGELDGSLCPTAAPLNLIMLCIGVKVCLHSSSFGIGALVLTRI